MAIQLPNPGLGDGQTGDNEFVMWTKVKDNFSNTTHAASKLVGDTPGQVVVVNGNTGLNLTGWGGVQGRVLSGNADRANITFSGIYRTNSNEINFMPQYSAAILTLTSDTYLSIAGSQSNGDIVVSTGKAADLKTPSATLKTSTLYSTSNTTKDTATGFLKVSSPVLHVYNDSITKIHEAEQLDITVDKKGVGHYEIHGTTGLRKNDGWFMSPPRDLYGNVLCMIEVTEKDGVVILKTYKKKFDFETVSIVHDYDNPMDIPKGACVEFRFNDLPQEQLDEPIE